MSQSQSLTMRQAFKTFNKKNHPDANVDFCISNRKDKLKHYDMKLIEIKKRRQEIKRKTFDEEIKKKNEIKVKEIQTEKLKKNISAIKSEINQLLTKLETCKEKEMILINSNKEKYLAQIKEKITNLKEIRKRIRKLKEREREKRENEKMYYDYRDIQYVNHDGYEDDEYCRRVNKDLIKYSYSQRHFTNREGFNRIHSNNSQNSTKLLSNTTANFNTRRSVDKLRDMDRNGN
jgi:hypothetical protein